MGDPQVQSHPQLEAGQTQVKTNRPYHVPAPSKKPDPSKKPNTFRGSFRGHFPLKKVSADSYP